MPDDDIHFRLRIPASIKSQVDEAAKDARRSINTEVLRRLEASFLPPADDGSVDPITIAERLFTQFFDGTPAQSDYLLAFRRLLRVEEAALETAREMKDEQPVTPESGHLWSIWMSRFFLVERIKQRIKELEA